MYLRPWRFPDRPRPTPSARAYHRSGEPRARDRRGHRPGLQVAGRRTRAAVRATRRLRHSGCQQRLRIDGADVPRARGGEAGRSRHRDRGAAHAADAERSARCAQDAAAGRPPDRPDAEDRQGRTLSGGRPPRRHARRAADPHLLARRRRPVHHPAAGLHQGSGDRHAQHRHLPHAGVRWPHDGDALAAAQGRRAAPPRRRAAGKTARGRGRPQPGAGPDLLRHRADAGRSRRAAARRLPVPSPHRDGQVRHRRSRGARHRAHHPRGVCRAGREAARRTVRRSHRLLFPAGRLSRCSISPA